MQEIREAARKANALSFIEGNQAEGEDNEKNANNLTSAKGFEKKVGLKGS